MTATYQSSKKYDLEDRTYAFARRIRSFTKEIPKHFPVNPDINQMIRSSGSVGANYIEANEALSKKDFGMRIKICRKEAKETKYWLRLIEDFISPTQTKEYQYLLQETQELQLIFASIIRSLEH